MHSLISLDQGSGDQGTLVLNPNEFYPCREYPRLNQPVLKTVSLPLCVATLFLKPGSGSCTLELCPYVAYVAYVAYAAYASAKCHRVPWECHTQFSDRKRLETCWDALDYHPIDHFEHHLRMHLQLPATCSLRSSDCKHLQTIGYKWL